MTDQPGREPVPGRPEGEPERQLPVPRPPSEVAPGGAVHRAAERRTHSRSRPSARRRSSASRAAPAGSAFLATLIVVVFVIVYYFYELGVPGICGHAAGSRPRPRPRRSRRSRSGYNIFQANCARCHGAQGQGGIGPVLNDQMKLFTHLNPAVHPERALRRRPLRLRQPEQPDAGLGPVERRAAQLRADRRPDRVHARPERRRTFVVARPVHQGAGHGRDAARKRRSPAGATRTSSRRRVPRPFPAAGPTRSRPPPSPGAVRLRSAGAVGLAGASAPGGDRRHRRRRSRPQNIAFDTDRRSTAPAGQAFTIAFDNQDAGIPHNIEIKDASRRVGVQGRHLHRASRSRTTTSRRSRPAATRSSATCTRT